MEFLAQAILTIICSLLASSGLWAFLMRKVDKNDASKQLLIGLAHDRIMYLGQAYLDRGWIRIGEYEDLNKYLYEPYRAAGGNGTAEQMMHKVSQLEFKPDNYKDEEE